MQIGRIARTVAVTAAAGALLGALALPASARDMSQNRLTNADFETENWLIVNGNYAAHRYSRLNQINRGNVDDLRIVMMLNLGGQISCEGCRRSYTNLEATPIAEDGFLYIPDGWGVVYKIDIRNGNRADFVWVMDPEVDKAWAGDVACCGINNRGIGLWKDQVISTVLDTRVVATNKESGEVTWEVTLGDPAFAETMTVAPLIVNDITIVGQTGAEYGIRGWLVGIDNNTGEEIWRTHTAGGNDRDPTEIAKSTWTDTWSSWETGGGSIWQTGTYDPDLHTMYWGTGNPGPDYDAEYRPGDNLYTDSLLAMNPDDGFIKWYFQFTPNDPFDYDEIAESPLVTTTVDGIQRNMVVHVARNGHFYGFDRHDGGFVYAHGYPNLITWTDGIDQKTGLPNSYNPNADLQDYNGNAARRGEIRQFCPSIGGGKNWEPSSFDPERGMIYFGSGEGCAQRFVFELDHLEGKLDGTHKWRTSFTGGRTNPRDEDGYTGPEPGPRPIEVGRRSMNIVDVSTGMVTTKIMYDNKTYGQVSTAGGLLITANRLGDVIAMDADNLSNLWTFNVGSAVKAPPMTFGYGGQQYLAVLVGALPGGTERRIRPSTTHFNPANYMLIFSL